ncbi:MAG TPA: CocE/NonD family hydrolase [Candidatus Thermoplasmatota archaeon]|nr:CocE/NonD family hydrolase [Candidatus Thermoplasmatota archaeon]
MKTKQKISVGILFVILLLASLLVAGCVKPTTYMVPMRDGVKLATDVYLPKGTPAPRGVILIRTPYDKNTMKLLGSNWAGNGYRVVIQDNRGRYSSEGNDTVFRNDYQDGPDTIAWVVNQTWCNSEVATWGGSALGIVQYLAAGADPPGLSCQYIQVAAPNLYKYAMFPGGEFRKNMVEEWLKGQHSSYMLPPVLAHENYTLDFWHNTTIDDHWEQVNVPAIHIGGWYDIFSQGTIDGFQGYQYLGGPFAQGRSKLIMGPWTHTGGSGNLTYPKNAADNFSQALFWEMFDEYTNNGSTAYDEWPAVTYYVMGDVDNGSAPGNEWRYAHDWPIPCTERAWYFQADGSLQTVMPGGNAPSSYTYDPEHPVPTVGGANLEIPAGPRDQRPVENRSDVLVFTSPVLSSPYEATGKIKARLYVSSNCSDTDFTVKLTDVYPDGRSMLITDGILRMRNRDGPDHWELMEPGTIYQVEVDLWSTSYIWNTGHRIRIDVSSSNYPRCLNNPNTADGIYKNTTYNLALNTVYLDNARPSCVLLPEISQNSTQGPYQGTLPAVLLAHLTHGRTAQTPWYERLLSRFPGLNLRKGVPLLS